MRGFVSENERGKTINTCTNYFLKILVGPHSAEVDLAALLELFVEAAITRQSVLVRQEQLEMPDWEDHAVLGAGQHGQQPQHHCVTPTRVVRMQSATLAMTTLAILGPSALVRKKTIILCLLGN